MQNQPKTITLRVIVLMLFFIIVVPFLPLLLSSRWNWWEAWVYAITGVLGFAISRALAARRHPDILAERARFLQQPDAKSWDKILSPLLGLGGGLIPLVAGLDARFNWSSSFGWLEKILSLILLLVGYVLASYALIENRFFSGMVRIQTERGHQVVTSGPYRWIRHPGYAGALMAYWATPLFLDSPWTFLPVVLVTLVVIVRTALEDQALQNDLVGYHDYTKRVPYRLLPRVW